MFSSCLDATLTPHKVLLTGVVYDLLVKGSQHLDICACRLLHFFSPISSFSSQVTCLKRLSTGKISLHPYLHGLSLWASGCISHHSTTPPLQSWNIFIILLSNGCLRATFTLSFYSLFVFASFHPFTLSFQSQLFIFDAAVQILACLIQNGLVWIFF